MGNGGETVGIREETRRMNAKDDDEFHERAEQVILDKWQLPPQRQSSSHPNYMYNGYNRPMEDDVDDHDPCIQRIYRIYTAK